MRSRTFPNHDLSLFSGSVGSVLRCRLSGGVALCEVVHVATTNGEQGAESKGGLCHVDVERFVAKRGLCELFKGRFLSALCLCELSTRLQQKPSRFCSDKPV